MLLCVALVCVGSIRRRTAKPTSVSLLRRTLLFMPGPYHVTVYTAQAQAAVADYLTVLDPPAFLSVWCGGVAEPLGALVGGSEGSALPLVVLRGGAYVSTAHSHGWRTPCAVRICAVRMQASAWCVVSVEHGVLVHHSAYHGMTRTASVCI
jgi:hypothetical protein